MSGIDKTVREMQERVAMDHDLAWMIGRAVWDKLGTEAPKIACSEPGVNEFGVVGSVDTLDLGSKL